MIHLPRRLGAGETPHARSLLCGLLAVFLFFLTTAGAPLPARAADPDGADPADVAGPEVTATITQVTPLQVGPDDEITVTVVVRNTTSAAVLPRLDLSIVRYRLTDSDLLRRWLAGDQQLIAPTFLDRVTSEEEIPAGGQETFSLTIPASDLRLLPYPEASGARGLIAAVTDTKSGRLLTSGRGFLQWFPTDTPAQTALGILAPLTAPGSNPGNLELWGKEIASLTAPEGRLSVISNKTRSAPVSWLVDPALVGAAITGVGGDGAAVWARDLLTVSSGREVFATAPFDPDVAAFAAASRAPFQPGLSNLKTAASSDALAAWRTDLVFPATGTNSVAVVDHAASYGTTIVAVDAISTSTGTAAVSQRNTPDGEVAVLHSDPDLTRLFRTASGDPATEGGDPVLARAARSQLLAELATLAQNYSGTPDSRLDHAASAFIALERDWQPNPALLEELLTSLTQAGFVNLVPLAELSKNVAYAPPGLPQSVPNSEGLAPGAIQKLHDQLTGLTALGQAVPRPELVSEPFLELAAAASSIGWRTQPAERTKLVLAAEQAAAVQTGKVQVIKGSDINLISDRGDLPIRVRNDLDQPVTARIALRPNDSRLSITATPEVEIPPRSIQSVAVPAKAIGSGNVEVQVTVLGADGTELAPSSRFTVRVRADWENVGTLAISATLALLFVFGIWRTIRRGRSNRRLDPVRPLSKDELER